MDVAAIILLGIFGFLWLVCNAADKINNEIDDLFEDQEDEDEILD